MRTSFKDSVFRGNPIEKNAGFYPGTQKEQQVGELCIILTQNIQARSSHRNLTCIAILYIFKYMEDVRKTDAGILIAL
jgi:hypothetical protein